jgi:site-specific DNA-methyltransferase (adenine-specific)
MKGQKALFSSASNEWETPQGLFDTLNKEFQFDCDAAATASNCKVGRFFAEGSVWDALKLDWSSIPHVTKIFLNPPYGQIAVFMKKAYEESLKGLTVVCLIPARTDTKYFHEYCMKSHEIRFIKGRLKFTNSTLGEKKLTSATFPSCIVIFDHKKYDKNNDPILTVQE